MSITNVETMFDKRKAPWAGLGADVKGSRSTNEVLSLAGLDWQVLQENIYDDHFGRIDGYKANIRDKDRRVLGVVTDKYHIVQNDEAFAFTEALVSEGLEFETAGSIKNGKTVWIQGRLPHEYIINGDNITPYICFTNTHDGSAAVKVCLTPIRVVCQNSLNLALKTTPRCWSMIHKGNVLGKMEEARTTLFRAEEYMNSLGEGIDQLQRIRIPESKVLEYIDILIPEDQKDSRKRQKNIKRLRDDLKMRYFDAPDLKYLDNNAYRFVNAVSDFATHAEPIRKTNSYKEGIFAKTLAGNPLIDKAYHMALASA